MSVIVCDRCNRSPHFGDTPAGVPCERCEPRRDDGKLCNGLYVALNVCPDCHRPRLISSKYVALKNTPYYCWIDYAAKDPDKDAAGFCTPEDALEHCRSGSDMTGT